MPKNIALLEEKIKLNSKLDEIIEETQKEQISLPHTLNKLLKEFINRYNMISGFIYTYDESLNMKFFYRGDKNTLEKYNLKMLKDISAPITLKKIRKS